MRTLHLYIVREMLATILVAVMVCAGLLLLGNLLKEVLSLLMTGQATFGLVVKGIGLLLPFVLAFALPMGALTAALLVFGRLSADQELTAARANGISLLALAVPVVVLSLGLCGVCAWVNMDIAPRCRVAYKRLFYDMAQEKARTLIPEGRFVTDFPGFVVYAERIQGSDMEGVLFFQIKDGRKILDVRAPRARLELNAEQRQVRLVFLDGRALQWWPSSKTAASNTNTSTNSGAGAGAAGDTNTTANTATPTNAVAAANDSHTTVADGTQATAAAAVAAPVAAKPEAGDSDDGEGVWQTGSSGDLTVELTLPPAVVSGGLPALSDMTWRQLLNERDELRRLGVEDATPLEVHLHRQVAFSFASFGFALVGIPLGVRAHRRETSVGIALAIGLVLVYYAFLIVAQALESRPESAPWLIVWMPNVVFQGIGAWMLWRVNRGR